MYGRLIIQGASQLGEVWSCGLTFDPTGEFDAWDQTAGQLEVDAAAAVATPADLLNALSTAGSITGLRWEGRNDATDALMGAAEHVFSPVRVGTGTPRMPPQCASVISLKTDIPGGSGRGRVYWPTWGYSVGNDLRLSTATTDAVAAAFKSYTSALAGALASAGGPGPVFDLAIRSRKTHTTPHVNQLLVGNVVDTQRRRRDKLPEVFSVLSYP